MKSKKDLPYFNLLVAYPYANSSVLGVIKEIQDTIGDKFRWLLDSGAFTAYKNNRVITLDEYCQFLDKLPVKPWRYFTLDVMGNPIETDKNLKEMYKRGYNPVPIFTRGESLSKLDELYKLSDMIGLGALTGNDYSSVPYCYNMMKNNKQRPVHLLGFTRIGDLKNLRPYSCDSSSWTASCRYGACQIYLGFGKFTKWSRREASDKPSPKLIESVKKLGYDISELSKEENWRGGLGKAKQITATSWVQCSIDVEKNIGTKLFLAGASDVDVRSLWLGYKKIAGIE